MTITVFRDKHCTGPSKALSRDIADLKDKDFDKPSSIRLDDEDDAVLLFKNDFWHGGVMYLRGKQTVEDLGRAKEGGEGGFGNSIRSVRCSPFQLDLNVTVVTDGNRLPGKWKEREEAWTDIKTMVANANAFYAAEKALLTLEIARINFRDSTKKFEMNRFETVPNDWSERGEIDVVFVHRFTGDRGTIGRGQFPCFGQTVIVAAAANETEGADTKNDTDEMTLTLLHELGHYLGLSHGTADGKKKNLMFDSLEVDDYTDATLAPAQIEEMHQRLARNLSRRGDRN